MSVTTQIRLAGSSRGRIALHIAALFKDGKFGWHMKGILREF